MQHRLVIRLVAKYYHKFVATDASYRIRLSGILLEATSNTFKDEITRIMAEFVLMGLK